MKTASVGMTPFVADDARATSYRLRGGVWLKHEVKPAYYNVPAAGGVNASIEDMVAWLGAQLDGGSPVLSAEAIAMMRTPRVRHTGERRNAFPARAYEQRLVWLRMAYLRLWRFDRHQSLRRR